MVRFRGNGDAGSNPALRFMNMYKKANGSLALCVPSNRPSWANVVRIARTVDPCARLQRLDDAYEIRGLQNKTIIRFPYVETNENDIKAFFWGAP